MTFSWPQEVMLDEFSVVVDIYDLVLPKPPDDKDEWGNPLQPQRHYYAQDVRADLQPKSGTQRAVQSGTTYEATHTLYIDGMGAIPAGAIVDVKGGASGDVLASYTVVYTAYWGTHRELDLKAVTT